MKAAGLRRPDVRDGEVGAVAVDRRAPLDPAPDRSFAGVILPELRALPVRIDRERVPRFLRRDDDIAAALTEAHIATRLVAHPGVNGSTIIDDT